MKSAVEILEQRISAAMEQAASQKGLPSSEAKCYAALVRPATEAKFGDYQANGVMALAKKLKTNPRKLAEEVVSKLNLSDICEKPEVAGPGFINLRLKPDFIADRLLKINADSEGRLGVEKTAEPKTIVVDFSAPNIAKQMHVGHLRSTIIGDCICNILDFLGHKVEKQNHIGDWGTQFGMLCALLSRKRIEMGKRGEKVSNTIILADLEAFYREAKQLFDTDKDFADEARGAVVGLHRGNQQWTELWRQIVSESKKHYEQIYEELNVELYDHHIRGESAYKDDLPTIVEDLKNIGFAQPSMGAVCVFPDPDRFKNKKGYPLGLVIQKSDGAYVYATTDLAAIRYRVNELKADKIIYVTDARQKLHFEMLFAVADMAGWNKHNDTKVDLVHVTFGSVLGENGQPLKTREGENVKLKELLDEAVQRARKIVEEKNPDLPQESKDRIAKAVGIGAVKYSDFSNNRTSDYVFSFNKMLAMDGNTAPYMQYAYARIKSIERKAQSKDIRVEDELAGIKEIALDEPAELDLAKHLIRYGEAIEAAIADYRPNYLTAYLYELAQKFSVFYTNCPVLDAGKDKRPTRLLLCDLTARTIKHGLSNLLGIEVVEQM